MEVRFDYLFMKWYVKMLLCPESLAGNEICHETGVITQGTSCFSARGRTLSSTFAMLILRRIPTPNISPIPPHFDLEPHIKISTQGTCSQEAPTGAIRGIFNKYCQKKFSYVHVYTDRLKLSNGSMAAVMYIPSIQSATTWRLNLAHTVLGSEIFAILMALQFSCLDPRLSTQSTFLLTDSQSLCRQSAIPSILHTRSMFAKYKISSIKGKPLSFCNGFEGTLGSRAMKWQTEQPTWVITMPTQPRVH
jgi:hypothetical protein